MNHVYNLADVNLLKPSVVTIGVFDGVHLGHQHLIRQLVRTAHEHGRLAVVLTFFPHPDMVVRELGYGRYYLQTPEQRAAELLRLGVDCVITHPFNEQTRHIPAAEFVDQLLHHLRMAELWVGADFAMGYRREGTVSFLREKGAQKGFGVQVIDLLTATPHDSSAISSTLIRAALLDGNVEQVCQWLGRGYTVSGTVVHGDARGRTIGFPTANIAVWDQQALPAYGVYAGWLTLDGEPERYPAVTNIGIRPTFQATVLRVEAHILDFSRDIYDRQVTLSFEHRLRGEQKFDSINELIAQIRHDVEQARFALKT